MIGQIIGTVMALAMLGIGVLVGPKILRSEAWRDEQLMYEDDRSVETNTARIIRKNAEKMERIFELTNVSENEMRYIVHHFSTEAYPNSSALVHPPKVFKPRWKEANARAVFMENILMIDNEILSYPTDLSKTISTVLAVFGMFPATIVCAAMVATYQFIFMKILYYLTGMNRAISIETPNYMRAMVLREALMVCISIGALIFSFAVVCVIGWLESGKMWSMREVLVWAEMVLTGSGNSPVRPHYMVDSEMTLWLSLANFSLILNQSALVGLLLISLIRCYDSRDALMTLRLTEEEIQKAIKVDSERLQNFTDRPLYHN